MINPMSGATSVTEISENFISMNETFVAKAANFDVSNGEFKKVSNKDTFSVQENAMVEASNDRIEPKNNEESAKMIQLPNDEIPCYEANEELLNFDSFYEDSLVSHKFRIFVNGIFNDFTTNNLDNF